MTTARLKVGEQPDPFVHTFEDADGTAISVDDAWFSLRLPDGTTESDDATVVSGPDGEVSYQLAEVTQRGVHSYEFWATSGGERFASPTFLFYADPAVEAPA